MKNIRPLHEQVVVIIGASSGLGRQTAYDLATKRATVVVSSRSDEELEKLASDLKNSPQRSRNTRSFKEFFLYSVTSVHSVVNPFLST